MTSIYSVFDTLKQARQAIRSLQRLSLPEDKVRLSVSERRIQLAMEPTHKRTGRLVAVGAVAGAGLGLLGALLAFWGFDLEGIWSEQTAIPMIVVFSAAGLLLGGFVAGLLTAAIQGAEATQADRAVRGGKVVVSIEAEQEEADQISRVLALAGGKKADGTNGAERSDRLDQKSMD